MKKVAVILCLVATNAMAIDFDTEWAKFDFSKFKTAKVKKQEPVVTPITDSTIEKVDPKSPDRLGLKLSDAGMVERMKKLYANPDTVVYSTTIR
jgi:hypothetical protein